MSWASFAWTNEQTNNTSNTKQKKIMSEWKMREQYSTINKKKK